MRRGAADCGQRDFPPSSSAILRPMLSSAYRFHGATPRSWNSCGQCGQFSASSHVSNLAAHSVKIREPRPEVQFGRGSAQPSKAKTPGWLSGDEREPTRILEQSPLQRNLSKVGPRTWNAKIHNRRSQIDLAPIERHNRDWRLWWPQPHGVSGDGD